MDYDIEREKRKSEEVRKVFRELFPIAGEENLPWAICQIGDFLKRRIEYEVKENVHHFVLQISRVLCEVTPPKTHMVDMARIVVEKAKEADRMRERLADLNRISNERTKLLACVREIGKTCGCNHTEDADGWMKLPQCVEDLLRNGLKGDS